MTENEDDLERFRMDFVQRPVVVPYIVEADEDDEEAVEVDGEYFRVSHMSLEFRLQPHPDRYDRIDDPPGWLDTFDNTIIPDDVLNPRVDELEEALQGEESDDLPRYYDPPEIEDPVTYVRARKKEMELALSGEKPLRMVEPDRQNLGDLVDAHVKTFVIFNIDLVDSTALNIGIGNEMFAKIMQIYMTEATNLIHNFHGNILNIAGDGIVAYFPGPNVNGMHDNAIDCARCMKMLIEEGINEVFQSSGYPPVRFRIGINTGNPEIIPEGESNYNLLGNSVNISTAIQNTAETNEILLGQLTVQNLHTKWRKNTEKVTDDRDWDFEINGETYDIYSYNT